MISRDTYLYIYEVRGVVAADGSGRPSSFIGLWNEEDFSYLFFHSPEDVYVNALCHGSDSLLTDRYEMAYGDWQSGIPDGGLCVGDLTIVPADHPNPPPGAVVLDPSVVFGDGSHPTTLRCLSLLDTIIRDHVVESLLDLGTGSGILALAAAAIGVPRVLGVDRNQLAIQTAKTNVELNGLSGKVEIQEGEAAWFLDHPFDLVAANLPFQVLREVVQLRPARDHRFWIVSGINREQAEVLKGLLHDNGIRTTVEFDDPPWVTFAAERVPE
jgi:ribosomal protein L11 methyltransferase